MPHPLQINNIPALLYGESSGKLFLFVHGRHSRKEEAGRFAAIAAEKGYQVLSFDLPEHGERKDLACACTVQNAIRDLKEVHSFVQGKYQSFSLYACSIGAYFCLSAYQNVRFEKCLFLSPVLNMERLIQNMMMWANVSEKELKEKGKIETSFGETLSWDYYEFVRNHPVGKWDKKTFILYGEKDNMTERNVLNAFVEKNHCTLDVLKNGEHYFHTAEQLSHFENWVRNSL